VLMSPGAIGEATEYEPHVDWSQLETAVEKAVPSRGSSSPRHLGSRSRPLPPA